MVEEKMPKKIRDIIKALQAYEPESIYLFGSWASEEHDDKSDVDLVVIKNTDRTFFDRLHEVSLLLPAEVGGVEVLVYTPQEFEVMRKEGNAFAEMIAEEGRLIYAR
jgi:predicted nucleotidyltransferase